LNFFGFTGMMIGWLKPSTMESKSTSFLISMLMSALEVLVFVMSFSLFGSSKTLAVISN
jgi:hypothetical protein